MGRRTNKWTPITRVFVSSAPLPASHYTTGAAPGGQGGGGGEGAGGQG